MPGMTTFLIPQTLLITQLYTDLIRNCNNNAVPNKDTTNSLLCGKLFGVPG